MKIAIVIPARLGSTRLPNKPLAKLGDKMLIQHVVELALVAKSKINFADIDVIVASDDVIVLDSIKQYNVIKKLTEDCVTGSDRVYLAVKDDSYDFIINLQGDAPFTNPEWIVQMILDYSINSDAKYVSTLGIRLDKKSYLELVEHKKLSMTSGTTVTVDFDTGFAYWFSKSIIPNIRTQIQDYQVVKHVGIYGYPMECLSKFYTLKPSFYEKLEGLEQLRLLENKISIKVHCINVDNNHPLLSIDTQEVLNLANEVINATYSC